MITNTFPNNTETSIKLKKLYKYDDKCPFSDKMSSRMISCASVIDEKDFIGWQIDVPTKGTAQMSLFSSSGISLSDLEWISEKAGDSEKQQLKKKPDSFTGKVYELYLPISESQESAPTIGFESQNTGNKNDREMGWPDNYLSSFEEVIKALRILGGVLRIVVGSANKDERERCRKEAIKTFSNKSISCDTYTGNPVRFTALLLLGSDITVRLKSVFEDSIPEMGIRLLGDIKENKVNEIWNEPLSISKTLPNFAARIMVMEPRLNKTIIGINVKEESVKKTPLSHKIPNGKTNIEIGKAMDSAGVLRKVSLGELDLRRHLQIVGQTGTGKSTMLATLILSAITKGYGLTFFDPHGTTIDTILQSVPEEYSNRIRVVRIGDSENPVPLNIWDSDSPIKEERNISDLCELFGDLFNPPNETFVGPRYERWLSTFAKASLAFLGHRASLESIAIISQSKTNMRKVCEVIESKYPELVETIKQEYGTDNSSDFQSTLNWYLCKFQRLIAVEQLRKTLGAGINALDFNNTIDTNTVNLIDLASPTIGTQPARIIGTLTMMKLWNAVLNRKDRDKTHLVVVDEASLFQTNPMPRMLAESRKFGLSMILSHQHTGQFSTEIKDALEANSANFCAFRLSPKDAYTASIRFNDSNMEGILTRLDAFNAMATVSVDGKQTMPFSLETIRPHKQKNGEAIAKAIEAHSIRTLVDPYRSLKALTAAEINDLINNPWKKVEGNPRWLDKWARTSQSIKKLS